MRIRVISHGELTEILGKELDVHLPDGNSVSDLLHILEQKSGSIKGQLGDFKVAEDIAILLNGKNIYLQDGFDTRLNEGDTINLLLPFAGG